MDNLLLITELLQQIWAALKALKNSTHPWIQQGRWCRCGPCHRSWWTSACRSSSPHPQSGRTWGGSSGRWWGAGTPSACGDRWKDEEPESITRRIIIITALRDVCAWSITNDILRNLFRVMPVIFSCLYPNLCLNYSHPCLEGTSLNRPHLSLKVYACHFKIFINVNVCILK